MSVDVREFKWFDLRPHPWQQNIPDIPDAEWKAFKKDVRKRGVQEPITVSLREGVPVIVDGHQRFRAAKELDIEKMTAIVKEFASEDDEVIYLANSARFRRHLSDPQKVAIGMAYEKHFKPLAKANQGKRSDLSHEPDIETERTRSSERSAPKAAEAVGMSPTTYKRGKAIAEHANPEVKAAWGKGELSTTAAYEKTQEARRTSKEPDSASVEVAVDPEPQPKPARPLPKAVTELDALLTSIEQLNASELRSELDGDAERHKAVRAGIRQLEALLK